MSPSASMPVLLRLAALFAVLFLIMPLLVVLPMSLTPQSFLSLPTDGVSLQHYAGLWTDAGWSDAVTTSFAIAALSAAVALILGTAFAVAAWHLPGRTTTLLNLMLYGPMIVPPVIYGVGIFRLWADLGMLDTFAGVLVVHVVLGLPFVIVTIGTTLATLDRRMAQAARSLGASPLQAIRRVILPNIVPGMLAGGLFAFVASWDEVVVTLMITSRRLTTLQRQIWQGIVDAVDPRVAAVGTLLILLTVGVLVAERLLARRSA
jgi:putative spermidine/putrescine transport system permease protein